MRSILVIAALAGTAHADGVVVRVGTLGGTDSPAPGGRDDGFAGGAGYRAGNLTGELVYDYLDYDGTSGIGGGSHRVGGQLQYAVAHSHNCRQGDSYCPHLDLEAGVGRRWIKWENDRSSNAFSLMTTTAERQGMDYRVGVSVNFGLRFALEYFAFHPDSGDPSVVCRSTSTGGCPMQVDGTDHGVLLEASFALGN